MKNPFEGGHHVDQEEGKKLFGAIHAALNGAPSESIPDGLKAKPAEREEKKARQPDVKSVPSFRTGMSAMDEWQREQERKQD